MISIICVILISYFTIVECSLTTYFPIEKGESNNIRSGNGSKSVGLDEVTYYCSKPHVYNLVNVINNDPEIVMKLDVWKPVHFYVHGWRQIYTDDSVADVARQYVKFARNVNICLVDWSKPASDFNYGQAAENTESVGRILGKFMKYLTKFGPQFRLDRMHCIGFSLGAHVCGNAGMNVDGHLSQIVGLDAAGPLFYTFMHRHNNERLDESDAAFVQVLHTSCFAGTEKVFGKVDVFANGDVCGLTQPGCQYGNETCNHEYANQIFRSSLNPEHRYIGKRCASGADYKAGLCDSNDEIVFGLNMRRDLIGRFYITAANPHT